MPHKLSDAQFVALVWMVKRGNGKLVRWPGGFWTIPEMPKENRPRYAAFNYDVPLWHTGTQTVMAMERAGLVKFSDDEKMPHLRFWEAPRGITPAGRAALDAAIDDGQRRRIIEDQRRWNLRDALNVESAWGKR